MLASVLSLVSWVLGLFKPKDTTAVELAASNATAQTELAGQESVNATEIKAASTRAAADAAVVSIVTKPSATDATTSASIKEQFPDAYR
jgi:hypothetical protein